jgi:ATP-dependent helicase Lhr and Lhr-like helicase
MIDKVEAWFSSRGWSPFDFQRECWEAQLAGRSGLVHAPTGLGKTYAAWMGTLMDAARAHNPETPGLRALWITPLRALANDTADALRAPLDPLGLNWRVDQRTGDTSTSKKTAQRKSPPQVLVTTPESLTILISYPDHTQLFSMLRTVIVDEWHELLSTKRGVQTELALARLRAIQPELRTWGLSATLSNLEQAADALVGVRSSPAAGVSTSPANKQSKNTHCIIRGLTNKSIQVQTLLPDDIERYPWAGHIGLELLSQIIDQIEQAGTTLLFTNTRAQTEIWFSAILRKRPDLLGHVAVHHGSLDRAIREEVEDRLRAGRSSTSTLRCVVCTSSLDLGVDFAPVDQVIQIGSPKGVARLLQRAGRSGHQPGATSRIVCVPSHAFELIEFAAARAAMNDKDIEARTPLHKPLDVLVQHLVTLASGGALHEQDALREVRSTFSFQSLSDDEWDWAMDFVTRGGPALTAYPDYARLINTKPSSWSVASARIEQRHRMGIGTIVADSAVRVKFASGKTLGTIEESFIARLRTGDRFVFSGRVLELVRLREMTATVRTATTSKGVTPRWNGGRMPLSSQLAHRVRTLIRHARDGVYDGPEMLAIRGLLERQRSVSILPGENQLLVEQLTMRDGEHVFIFTFAGRLAHEGLGAVLAWRLTRRTPSTVRASATDYGIELFCDDTMGIDEDCLRAVLSTDRLADDLIESLNATELARRQFREIARIAGLTFQGYPGRSTPDRHLQASSDMFYDVFREFDTTNLLLSQAQREVVEGQLEFRRLEEAMNAARSGDICIVKPQRLTPMAFPLWAETLRSTHATSEAWETRVRKMAEQLEQESAAQVING